MLLVTVITYILNLLDLVFTLHLAKEYGDDIEGNLKEQSGHNCGQGAYGNTPCSTVYNARSCCVQNNTLGRVCCLYRIDGLPCFYSCVPEKA